MGFPSSVINEKVLGDLRIGLTGASVYGIIIIRLGAKKSRKLVEFSLRRQICLNILGDSHEIYDKFSLCRVRFFLTVCLFLTPGFAQLEMDTLVGLWLFDEGSGDTAADSSNSALDADLVGNPTWVSGVFGSGLELDGSGASEQVC